MTSILDGRACSTAHRRARPHADVRKSAAAPALWSGPVARSRVPDATIVWHPRCTLQRRLQRRTPDDQGARRICNARDDDRRRRRGPLDGEDRRMDTTTHAVMTALIEAGNID